MSAERTNEILEQVRAETAKLLGKTAGPVERGKALAAKLPKPKLATAKTTHKAVVTGTPAEPTKTKSLDVIEFGKRAKIIAKPVAEQTKYERRGYLRDFYVEEVDENTVTHMTSHTQGQIYERLLAELQKMYAERDPKDPNFKTRDVINRFKTFGSSYGDIVRSAFKKLAKDGKVEITEVSHGPKRHTFNYKLLQLTPIAQAPAKAQVVTQTKKQ